MHTLIQMLERIHPLSPALLSFLHSIVICKIIPKGEYLLKAGQVSQLVYFIEKGLCRCYTRQDETVTNNWFAGSEEIFFSAESFIQQRPGSDYIQALEDTTLWFITHGQLQEAFRQYPEFNLHARVLMQQHYLKSARMLYPLRLRFKTDRYHYMKDHFPELLNKVPITHLASYLQMSVFTLSRIRCGHR